MTNRAEGIKAVVRAKYALNALGVVEEGGCGCGCGSKGADPITRDLYSVAETATLPDTAVKASLGCGTTSAPSVWRCWTTARCTTARTVRSPG